MAKAFPKQIYVTREDEGTEDEYLSVRAVDVMDETENVAVYQLVEVGQIVVERQFVPAPKKARRR